MLEDLDGSLNAMLSLREFMSNQYVSKLVTNTQAKDGEPKQRILEANGPICIVGATTQEKIYEDNSNRSYIIHVDESKAHQKAVMHHQNKQAAGLINQTTVKTKQTLLQNMQRLLLPISIQNPFQPDLELPESVFKPLRTNQHYIALQGTFGESGIILVVVFGKKHSLKKPFLFLLINIYGLFNFYTAQSSVGIWEVLVIKRVCSDGYGGQKVTYTNNDYTILEFKDDLSVEVYEEHYLFCSDINYHWSFEGDDICTRFEIVKCFSKKMVVNYHEDYCKGYGEQD
jgi:hypothetical protein